MTAHIPAASEYCSIDNIKNGQTVYVTTDLKKLKAEWEEAGLGNLSDNDLSTYMGCPGKILEVEEDDDTVQLEWVNMDSMWIPAMACVPNLPESARKTAPAAFIPRLNGEGADNMEEEIAAKQASTYVPPAGDYIADIESAKCGSTVYVTNDLKKLKAEWEEAGLGNLSDNDLMAYTGCPGKILEVEEDDDTVKLEWINMDSMWIPALACVKDLPESVRKTAPVAFIPRLNGEGADNMEEEIAAKQADYTPPTGDYLKIEGVKVNDSIYVTNDVNVLKKEWEEAGLGTLSDADLAIYTGCPGKVLEIEEDDDTVKLEWLTMDTMWIPVMACVKDLPKAVTKPAPAAFIPRLNGEGADNMESEIAAKQAATAGGTQE